MLPSIFGERFFDDFFDNDFDKQFFGAHNPLYGKHAQNLMKTDILEAGDRYEMDIDLPGFRKEDLNLELNDGYLTISASKGLDKDEKNKDGHYIRRERYTGKCARSFYVGDVQPSEIGAKYEDGILRLTLPKKDAPALPATNRIAIE